MSTIFVSSTFQDMNQERDIIQNKVLPRIKEFAKNYGRNIDICDLRWGVNSIGMNEEESTSKVLQVCFDEIENSKPFFIAILGDRYGWTPNTETIKNHLSTRDIESKDMLEKSVTEMEIMYRLTRIANTSQVRFYFRTIKNSSAQNNDLPSYYISSTKEDIQKMEILKEYIKTNFAGQVRTYSVSWNKNSASFDDMDGFADMLFEDIKDIIVKNWGDVPELSGYDNQFYQYQYVMEGDCYYLDQNKELTDFSENPELAVLNQKNMNKQNYVLISSDEYGLNIMFSSLCKKYSCFGAEIIPYECSQSVLSSSTENLVDYFTYILESRFGNAGNDSKELSSAERFHAVLAEVDSTIDYPLILAVRNIQYLDNKNIFEWFPLEKYNHIHFILSCNKLFSGSGSFKEITKEFFFQNGSMYSRINLIESYMANSHKELDNDVLHALIEKSRDKDDQYLELLMQRLLMLSQKDFEAIKRSGDGIDKISQYLQNLVSEAPDNTGKFVLMQLSLLESEARKEFVYAILAVLSFLPYGISLNDLICVLNSGNILFSTLEMSILCRRLQSVINVTLDGYYRMLNTPVSKIFTDILLIERKKWSVILEKYMSVHYTDENFDKEFYRSQYLEVALTIKKNTALSEYLSNLDYDVSYISLIFYRILSQDIFKSEMKSNFINLGKNDIKWIVTELCPYFSTKNMFLDKTFSLNIANLLNTVYIHFKMNNEFSEENNFIIFRLLFEIGQIQYLHEIDDAEKFLNEAKQLSKENFRKYPNRIWKMLHGIKLSDKEKRMGYDDLEYNGEVPDNDNMMFGFSDEIEDMEFEQSWSHFVRIINNYLSAIYNRKGDKNAAKALEDESKKLTHMYDPDPQNTGERKITPDITMIWPDELDKSEDSEKKVIKHSYKPDLRRNSAIQMSKEALQLRQQEKNGEAIAKLEASNEILKEIYEDGKTGKYYDMKNVADEKATGIFIQQECARDIGLNYMNMIRAAGIIQRIDDLNDRVENMLTWAHIYDDCRNNCQSKSDLESYYLLAAKMYSILPFVSEYREKILDYIDNYFSYRFEAHINGEKIDRNIFDNFNDAAGIVYYLAINFPDIGTQITDFLLKHSNSSAKSNAFDHYLQLTMLMRDLLTFMWDNHFEWKGKDCSLEDIFFHNVENQCMLWQERNDTKQLKSCADSIAELLSKVRDTRNIINGVNGIIMYAMNVFFSGKYKDIITYADTVLAAVHRTKDIPDIERLYIYEKLAVMYSEAEILDKAELVACELEDIIENLKRAGYSEKMMKDYHILPAQFNDIVISKEMIMYVNHAIILSRAERSAEADEYLSKAEKMLIQYPDVASSEPGVLKRISLFRKNGLPKSKKNGDSEKIYRHYKTQIESMLSKCLKSRQFDETDLQQIIELIEKMSSMPEHEIYKDSYTMAKYYNVLYMLSNDIGCKDTAIKMLKKATCIADDDNSNKELYAEIYSDMCAYTYDLSKRLYYAKKALAIYESLRNSGKEYSQYSYAMTLHNLGLIIAKEEMYDEALNYSQKALYIWESIYFSKPDKQTGLYLSEEKRLIEFLKTKVK